MEWNTFVDDAKEMGTSLLDTFSSAFNNAMGELLFTATTLTDPTQAFQPTDLFDLTWWQANVIIAYVIHLHIIKLIQRKKYMSKEWALDEMWLLHWR